jgi:hypothetical protein
MFASNILKKPQVHNPATLKADVLLAFREKPYWKLEELVARVKQPEQYVKKLLQNDGVCQKVGLRRVLFVCVLIICVRC